MFHADRCFRNAAFYTMEREGGKAEALVVHDHKIVFAGSAREAERIPVRETVDLGGAAVLPGFNDTHCHIEEMAEAPFKVNLVRATCVDEVVKLLSCRKEELRPGDWIVGCNLEGGQMRERRLPNRYELDRVSEEIPVFISDIGLHNFMCNSALLRKAGLVRGFSGAGSELLTLDETGEPTGVCREHGLLRYLNADRPMPAGGYEQSLDALERALLRCSRWGYTTLHTYDGFSGSILDRFSTYQELERRGRLPVRMILNRTDGVDNELGAISGLGSDRIKYGAVKFFADGTYAEHSAYLQEPYEDLPESRGRLIRTPEELKAAIRHAYEKGNDVTVHVIGDGAAALVIGILEEIYDPENQARFLLIHCHLLPPALRERMAKLPVIAAMQPIFIQNLSTATVHVRIGSERVKNFHAFRSVSGSGIMVAGGTDGPVSDQNPILGISKAVNRIDCFGRIFQPQERLSVFEAVGLYTKNAAFCAHEERLKGTLTAGKLADFILLDRDIFRADPKDLENVRVTAAYLGGERVS